MRCEVVCFAKTLYICTSFSKFYDGQTKISINMKKGIKIGLKIAGILLLLIITFVAGFIGGAISEFRSEQNRTIEIIRTTYL